MLKTLLTTLVLIPLTGCAFATTKGSSHLVYISDGSKQCQQGRISLSEHLALLTQNKINVSAQFCGEFTNMSYMAVCGGPTGKLNLFKVSVADLENAQTLGFNAANDLPDSVNIKSVPCSTKSKTPNKKLKKPLF